VRADSGADLLLKIGKAGLQRDYGRSAAGTRDSNTFVRAWSLVFKSEAREMALKANVQDQDCR